MKYNEIAVIGTSCKFAHSNNMSELRNNLLSKRDCIRKIPTRRLELLNMDADREYVQMGYIDDIEYFDNEFFSISSYEASMMSPEQRISLQLACSAIQDAGYSLDSFRGKRCGVFMCWADNEYESKLANTSSVSTIGSMSSMTGGNIGYHLDLRAATVTYDSSCSSGLYAIHEACIKLMLGEIDYALVGGVTVYLTLNEVNGKSYDELGLTSNDFRSRSFDDRASGVGLGEGGGFILLQRFTDAQTDKNNIYGVIHSGATTGDGGRSSNATLPSTQGQSEVFDIAWKGIDVSQLTEIEAHGIGTIIGDSVEAGSMINSLDKANVLNKKIKLGSVKSNIGHLSYAAGISGMIKVLTGFKYNESYGIANLQKPNKLVDFESSQLDLLRKTYVWNKNEQRFAGISAFGLNGTNTHIVVSNYTKEKVKSDNAKCNILKLSARTKNSFIAYKNAILQYMEQVDDNLNDILYTLNSGRDDYEYRRMISIESKDDLIDKLDMLSFVPNRKNSKVYFAMMSEENDISSNKSICDIEETFKGLEEINGISVGNYDEKFKFKMYRFCRELGINAERILADARSRALVQYANGKIGQEELDKCLSQPIGDGHSKLVAYLNSTTEEQEILIVNFGQSKSLKNEISKKNIKVLNIFNLQDFVKLLVYQYNEGNNIVWDKLYGHSNYNRVSSPTYIFDKISHWGKFKKKNNVVYDEKQNDEYDVVLETQQSSYENKKMNEEITRIKDIEGIIKDIFERGLGFDGQLDLDEDFFELGGNSILIQQMSGEFKKRLNTKVNLYDVYEYETIESLARHVYENELIERGA